MKKLISMALCLIFVFLLVPCTLTAAPAVPTLYMRPIFNEDKTHLTVEVYTYGLNWTSLDLGIQFDPAALELQAITDGVKIHSARTRGHDILTGSRDVAAANGIGYGNFVASVVSTNCRVTSYDGAIVIFSFTVKDLESAKTGYHLCVSHLTGTNGTPLINYTPFLPDAKPVVTLPNEENPFRYGDLTGDGVDMYDALLVMQYLVNLEDLDEYHKYVAAVSGQAEVSMYDALLIMQYLVDIIDSFPAEG